MASETETGFAESFINSFKSKLEPSVRAHLRNVYACLCLATVTASVAAWLGVTYPEVGWLQTGLLSQLAALGFLLALVVSHNDKQRPSLHFAFFVACAFFLGQNLVPFLRLALYVDPGLVVSSLLGTACVFLAFSACALVSAQGKWLYLGGPLLAFLNCMLLLLVASFFLGHSSLVFNLNVSLGLVAMCGFVLYDTQLIIEKRRRGDEDFVVHSVDLVMDLFGIFPRLLVVLSKRERKHKNKTE